ncbi:MAG: chemotaxis protein CheB [Pseudomonadales bacterium]
MDISHNSGVFASRSKSVVAIAASAGGLTAIEELLGNLSPASNTCYFILLHLANDKNSALNKRLAAKTSMPIRTMNDGMLISANTVYVLPPGHVGRLVNGEILLSKAADTVRAHPIDAFCVSLAERRDTHACGVFLSGVGEDGCLGAAKMKSAGKDVIVQSPGTARFPSLPERIIEICSEVDAVLPPDELAQWLSATVDTESANQQLPTHIQNSNQVISSDQHVLRGINAELHERIAFLEEKVSYLQSMRSVQASDTATYNVAVKPLNILLVDDDHNDRALIKAMLGEIAGTQYEVSEASNAGEAMELLTANSYDLCLLDHRLDGITASALLDALPDRAPQTSFVVISKLLDSASTVNQILSNAVQTLDKSRLTPEVLRNSIQKALQSNKTDRMPQVALSPN